MTNQIPSSAGPAVIAGGILKTDVLGRITIGREQREAILNAFELSGMSGQAFAQHHGIKIQTFASWMQKRRRMRGDYQNEAVCRKLRMRKDSPAPRQKKSTRPLTSMNLIEVDLQKDSQKDLQKDTPSTSSVSEPMEVVLPGGAVVRIAHESQLSLLQTLMRQLTC